MSIIRVNKPNFLGNSGSILANGYIYIGQPGLDGRTFANRKAVTFTDASGASFAATQPLRTNSSGQISFNGQPVSASVDGNYSMLILDYAETEITGGWTPEIEETGGSTEGLENYREYATTLADVKQLAVSTGETVSNIGKLTADDGDGADWLVVSATGSPADDIDLIDFDNGLQGERIENYQTDEQRHIIDDLRYLQIDNDLSEVDPANARANISAQEDLSDVSGYLKSTTHYTAETVQANIRIDTLFAHNTAGSIGPTSSGADYEWSALNAIPSNAKYIDFTLRCEVGLIAYPGPEDAKVTVSYRQFGTFTMFTHAHEIEGISGGAVFSSDIRIPVDGNNMFDIRWYNLNTSRNININIIGFGV